MNRLEIATQIFCSKPDLSYEESYHIAGLLIDLDIKNPMGNTVTESDTVDLSQRTAERTQQLIDLGFEWNKEHQSFERGLAMVITSDIELLCEEDWDNKIDNVSDEIITDFVSPVIKGSKEDLSNALDLLDKTFEEPTDFFKGNPYIEFEMPNTVLRLYRMDKQIEAEKDLQVTKKTESKYIMTHAENKEFELGITIFKK